LSHVCSRALTRIAASSSPMRQLTITTTARTQGRQEGTQPLEGATSSVQLLPGTCTSVTMGFTGSSSLCATHINRQATESTSVEALNTLEEPGSRSCARHVHACHIDGYWQLFCLYEIAGTENHMS
jgi:hypothetical protein